jgi:hypothetical protein
MRILRRLLLLLYRKRLQKEIRTEFWDRGLSAKLDAVEILLKEQTNFAGYT